MVSALLPACLESAYVGQGSDVSPHFSAGHSL
jgi:hypothetical protein